MAISAPDARPAGQLAGVADTMRHRWLLFLVCGGLAVAEAIGLQLVGFRSALPLAPQASAPATFGVYHDLRWVFTYSWSWLSVVWQLAALVVFRTAVTVTLIRLSWPVGQAMPPWPRLMRRNLAATVLSVVTLSPWAAIAFAAQAVAFSWFMIFSIVAAGVTVLVLPLAVTGRWWRRLVLWRSAGWAAVAWLAISVEALAVSVSPSWIAVATAFAGGLLNAVVWLGLVATLVHAGEPAHARPLAPIAIVAVLAVFLVGLGYAMPAEATPPYRHHLHPSAAPGARPVLYVAGFDSSYDGEPFSLFDTDRLQSWHYSYRGLGLAGPLAYDKVWTHQAVPLSADKLAAQVDWLAARTGGPVTVIAESEGTLVARGYFATHPSPPVDYYIMVSPLPRPARVYYPPAGHGGYGLAAGWETRALLRILHLQNPHFTAGADMPFTRSVVNNAALFRPNMLCPVPSHVRTVAFIPFAGATVVYHGPVSHVPWTALPGYHASLLHRSIVTHDIERLITTGQLTIHHQSTLAFRAIYGASAAWQAPALPLSLRPSWHTPPHSDPAFAHWTCTT
ncbi:MAG TPA: hypothetical protein VE673_19160 [Pseudonocardiaceae bacterium]|nr:hypothetical protein [Pseudonocardiaceae bacterium]